MKFNFCRMKILCDIKDKSEERRNGRALVKYSLASSRTVVHVNVINATRSTNLSDVDTFKAQLKFDR